MPIATVIAAHTLESGMISDCCDALSAAGCEPAEIEWLEPGRVFDIGFTGDIAAARVALVPFEAEADMCVQPGVHRRKMLLVSDMDSTMITVECIDELADYAGIKPQIAEITERAMQGELDFAQALQSRVALPAGLDESVIATCLADRVKLMPGARTLVQTMKSWGAHTILVSGGFTHFAEPVARQIGFAAVRANVLGLAGGKLTGGLEGDIVDADVKRTVLQDAASGRGIAVTQTLAVGDGANDIPMIEAAGLGAAYHAKPKASAAADFAIRHGDLTALLYAQGIRREDWVH
jgi:phosphoserine phosphatase